MAEKKSVTSLIDLPTPSFLIDLDILKRNGRKMLETADRLGVQLRPHVKTHKTLEIARISTEGHDRNICVSTIPEIVYFSSGGFHDILYAVPITENKIKRCQELVQDVPKLKLMFDSQHGVDCMNNNPRPDSRKWAAILEVDCGYGRTGIEWDSDKLVSVAKAANSSDHIEFHGIYTHCGNSYDVDDVSGIQSVAETTTNRMLSVSRRLEDNGIKCETIGTGSTPCCNHPTPNMHQLTEIHPGGYIFNDYGLTVNGATNLCDIAVRVACRVISHKPTKNQLVIDCGFRALTFNGMVEEGRIGGICAFQDHPELQLSGLCQELGKVTSNHGDLDFNKYPIGTMLFIYPYHGGDTAGNFPVFYVHSSGRVVDTWTPVRGW